MSTTIEAAGASLHCEQYGEGPAILVVHDIASGLEAWSEDLVALASAGSRAIGYDRRGYGSSTAPDPYVATTVHEQSEDAATVLDALGAAPATAIGEGFGALVVLDLLVRRPDLLRAAVLSDPPLIAFVPEALEVAAAERALLEDGLRAGGREAAVRAWVVAAGGDDARADRVNASVAGFFADYAGQGSWSPSRRELRAIGVPVAVVTGPSTPAHVVTAADAVAALLPDARRGSDGDAVGAALDLL